MAKYDISEEQNLDSKTSLNNNIDTNEQVEENNDYVASTQNPQGLSVEELRDPNKISVTIADKDAPIVVLFGPPACGKTMTLVRLVRYLKEHGYTIAPVKTFRPQHDKIYKDLCENFNIMINSQDAAQSTSKISFMLIKVSKNGRTLCQLLEAPGELYFNPKAPNTPFPKFLNAIKSCKSRKIWTIMVEPDWLDEEERKNYVERIQKLKTQMTTRDKAIIVYNKIDITGHVIDGNGNAHMAAAIKDIRDNYVGIFDTFRNTTPIVNLFKPFNCDFAIFQTGDYMQAEDGTNVFEQGPDVYPRRLWKIIEKRIRG